MDENIESGPWKIHYTDTYRYTCLLLPTTSQVSNVYRSELTRIYEILALLESVFILINYRSYQCR